MLTVGASSTEGTVFRQDDEIARYSSRGPTAIDYEAKPDLVAPGTGIVSLCDPTSEFYRTKSAYLLNGTRDHGLQAVPEPERHEHGVAGRGGHGRADASGEPDADAEPGEGRSCSTRRRTYHYDALTQGAGFLNAQGAVELARYFARAARRRSLSELVAVEPSRFTGATTGSAAAC